ncbi:MAG: hypothetical protein HGB12_00655 [Bacteroidetes bacterium]|nr:hypothetical protein [Bacteroidota bacterium]
MRLAFFICALFLLTACGGNKNKHEFSNQKEKMFYTDVNGMDYIRFPLIMPYEVMCVDLVEMNWVINLKDSIRFYSSITKVIEVEVTHDVILVRSTSTHQVMEGEKAKQWFVIIPSKKVEVGFTDETEFKDYLKLYGISVIKWIETNVAYKQFKETGCLPWIPGCSE